MAHHPLSRKPRYPRGVPRPRRVLVKQAAGFELTDDGEVADPFPGYNGEEDADRIENTDYSLGGVGAPGEPSQLRETTEAGRVSELEERRVRRGASGGSAKRTR